MGMQTHPIAAVVLVMLCGSQALAQSDAELRKLAATFPPMPREVADLVPFVGGIPTFASGTPYGDAAYTVFETDYIDGENGGHDLFMPANPGDAFPGANKVRLVRCALNTDLDNAYGVTQGDRIVLGSFGAITAGNYRSEADFNRDGVVNATDLGTVLTYIPAIPDGALSSAGTANRTGYCGYRFAPETEMYLARNRWNSPPLGRWIERDPLGYVDGMNLYEYVRGSVVNGVDPWGLQVALPLVLPRPMVLPRPIAIPRPGWWAHPTWAQPRPVWPAIPIPTGARPAEPIGIPVDGIPRPLEEVPTLDAEDATTIPYEPPPEGSKCPKDPCGHLVKSYRDLGKQFGRQLKDVTTCSEAKEMNQRKLRYWQLRWQADRCMEHHNLADGKHAQATLDAAINRQKWWDRVRALCNPEIEATNQTIRQYNDRVEDYYRQLFEHQEFQRMRFPFGESA